MKLKQIIILVVIIAALAGAVIFAYNSFNSGKSALQVPESQYTERVGSILPHGSKLNFDKVKDFNTGSQIFTYPAVTREETGPALNDIISQQ